MITIREDVIDDGESFAVMIKIRDGADTIQKRVRVAERDENYAVSLLILDANE